MICIDQISMSDQIKKNEMGGACSAMGVTEKVHIRFWWRD